MDILLVPNAVSLVFQIILSVEDIRTRRIPTVILYPFLVCGILWGILRGDPVQFVLSAVPGAVSLVIARVSGEKIGYGDGLVMLSLGGLIGCKGTVFAIMSGIMLSGLFSLGLIIFCRIGKKKISKDSRIPFLPFLLAGQIVGILIYVSRM